MPVPLGYTGEEVAGASSLVVAISASVTSGPAPWNFHATVGTGGSTGFDNPTTQAEFAWTGGRSYSFTHPVYGDSFNVSTDQKGHVFANVIDADGDVVCEGRAWDGSAFLTDSDTAGVTADATRGSASVMYFDSVGGNDGNDGLSTGAPKQSAAAIKTFLTGGGDRVAYVKYGSSWTGLSDAGGSWLAPSAGDAGGIDAYGEPGDGLPVFQADAANTGGLLIDMSSTRPGNFFLRNIILDGNGKSDAINVSGGSTAHAGFLADGCTFKNPDTSTGSGSLCGWNNVNFSRGLWYNCAFDRGTGDKVAHYCYANGPAAYIGCTWEGGGTTPTHDVYHLHTDGFLWLLNDRLDLPAAAGTTRNHLKLAAGQTDTTDNVECTNSCISDSFFRNMPALLALAGGDSSNPSLDGQLTNCVIQRCAFSIPDFGTRLGIHATNATTGLVIRDNLFWSAGLDIQYLLRFSYHPEGRIYRNRGTSTDTNGNKLIGLDETDGSHDLWFYENTWEKIEATCAFYFIDATAEAGCTFGPGNAYYSTGSNPWIAWRTDTSAVLRPLSAWQTFTGDDGDATFTNAANTDWVNSDAGQFEAAELAVLDADGFTEVAHQGTIAFGAIAQGSQQEVLLFNKGRRNNLTISSIGDTGNITPVSTPTVLKNPHRPYPYTFTADSGTGDTLTVNNDGPTAAFEINLTWNAFAAPAPAGFPSRGGRTGRYIRRR